jgi:hypothetical protein
MSDIIHLLSQYRSLLKDRGVSEDLVEMYIAKALEVAITKAFMQMEVAHPSINKEIMEHLSRVLIAEKDESPSLPGSFLSDADRDAFFATVKQSMEESFKQLS